MSCSIAPAVGRGSPKRTVTIGKHGAVTPEQARTEAKKLLADVTRGLDPAAIRAADKKAESVSDLIALYLADIEKTKKPRTVGQYRDVLRRIVEPVLGRRKAVAVTTAEAAKIHRDSSDRPFQANRALAVLSAMYGWAGKQHIVPPGINPAQHVGRYREQAPALPIGPRAASAGIRARGRQRGWPG